MKSRTPLHGFLSRQTRPEKAKHQAAVRRGTFLSLAVHWGGLSILSITSGTTPQSAPEIAYMIDLQFLPAEALGPPKPAAEESRAELDAATARAAVAVESPPALDQPEREPTVAAAPAPQPSPAETEPSPIRPSAETQNARSLPSREQRKEEKPRGGNSEGGESGVASGQNVGEAEVQGEGLHLRSEGAAGLEAAYLKNVVRQINRFFRKPGDAHSDIVEVGFWLNRNGSVSDIEVTKHRASFAFRIAAMEAVEQPGQKGLFGPLPESFPEDRVRISFTFEPSR